MIYFIRDEETGDIKIGLTASHPEGRRRACQTGNPRELVLLFQMEGSKQDEDALHERFADANVRGEWFKAVPELLLFIAEAKVSQLEAENARLQATLDEVRSGLGTLSIRLWGDDVTMPLMEAQNELSPLEAENAVLRARLQSERDERTAVKVDVEEMCRMLEER
ncbi:MAG: GIY-YIG nuclease family protein [Planctomycetes bacterium]|nr:GIY-YIG nuclease family protein [Planctomycetota bacterium]MBL7043601.1 GIY-YIG nuclease family protein [Pirellulaceae bacterium]